MENLMLSVNTVLPLFLQLAAGYTAQKFGILRREDVPRFNKVAFWVFVPCLLFYNVYSSDLSEAVVPKLILYAVLGVVAVTLLSVLGVKRFEPIQDRRGVIAQGIFRSNYVIMGLPIAQALAGSDQLGAVSILIAIVVPLFNFFAVFVLEGFRGEKVRLRSMLLEVVKNPLVISSVLGILCQLLHIRLPRPVEQGISSLGGIGTSLQLFMLGAFFQFSGLRRYKKALAIVTGIKLLLIPAVFLSGAALLGFRNVEFVSLFGIFASPTAVNSFTMVQQMHCGDEELAGDIVVSTSAFCMLSFFLWILVFKTFGVF